LTNQGEPEERLREVHDGLKEFLREIENRSLMAARSVNHSNGPEEIELPG
jgi:hypothetical protein